VVMLEPRRGRQDEIEFPGEQVRQRQFLRSILPIDRTIGLEIAARSSLMA
jgi:hypothetical protein